MRWPKLTDISDQWRLVFPEDSNSILQNLSEMSDDPNILSPNVVTLSSSDGELPSVYRPRIPPRAPNEPPSMLMVMLRDFGRNALTSGFIVEDGQQLGSIVIKSDTPPLVRQTVMFKNSAAVVDPVDIQRFVVYSYPISNDVIGIGFCDVGITSKSRPVSEQSRCVTRGIRRNGGRMGDGYAQFRRCATASDSQPDPLTFRR